MFIQRNQSLLENLFVAVSFDIVAGRLKLINVWETLIFSDSFKCFHTGDMFAALLRASIWLHHVIVRYNFIHLFAYSYYNLSWQKFGASLTLISQYTNLSLYWMYSIYDEIWSCKRGNSWPGLDWMGWAGTGGTGGMVVGMGPPAGAAAAAGAGGGGGAVSAAGGAAAVVLAATAETQSEIKPPQHSSTHL